ncbi:hypothetical protein N657DRAFT_636111 [Parathielavia appendiculata]|uniref:GPI anchored protein n=1 Tax=Parathielavia appendiculata TaxID=2587402 RepID=A0AAN6Z121_9PEZI|nr:hypothetical protein N657DRAFT_636111 [Parathielavia appendiculata]
MKTTSVLSAVLASAAVTSATDVSASNPIGSVKISASNPISTVTLPSASNPISYITKSTATASASVSASNPISSVTISVSASNPISYVTRSATTLTTVTCSDEEPPKQTSTATVSCPEEPQTSSKPPVISSSTLTLNGTISTVWTAPPASRTACSSCGGGSAQPSGTKTGGSGPIVTGGAAVNKVATGAMVVLGGVAALLA